METYFIYLVKASLCMMVLYFGYILFLQKETNFKLVRFYLLLSIILSLLIPLTKNSIQLFSTKEENAIEQNISTSQQTLNNTIITPNTIVKNESILKPINLKTLFFNLYLFVTTILLVRLVVGFTKLRRIYNQSQKIKLHGYTLVYSNQFKNSFSILNYIFINNEEKTDDEIDKIILHESLHVYQMHSIDLIFIEILSIILWFNPIIWFIRKSVQQTHEFLADEGVLNSGADKLAYQALLYNQVVEERFFNLSSGFSYSIIKKRIIMMNMNSFINRSKFKFAVIIPFVVFLFFSISFFNGCQDNSNYVTSVELSKMNVLYNGLENPVKIAISGIENNKLIVKIDQGVIRGDNGEYIIIPEKIGTAEITVFADGKEVKKSVFRVKNVPDPIVRIDKNIGGLISKDEILKTGKINIELMHFDYDVQFKVLEFSISVTLMGKNERAKSNNETFTYDQIQIINRMSSNHKFYIEDIKVIGPDNIVRNLEPIVFNIN